MNHPSIPESLKGKAKEKLDVIYAAGPGDSVFAIPLAVAQKYPCKDEHPPVPSFKQLESKEGESPDAEVAGHHRVSLVNGTYGYHNDWVYGPYLWHRDGCWYNGVHRHIWGQFDPRAIDMDDL